MVRSRATRFLSFSIVFLMMAFLAAPAFGASTWVTAQITTGHNATQLCQDGNRLAWTNGLGSVYTWKVGDSAPTQVPTPTEENEDGLAVSGDRITWAGYENGELQVYTWKIGDSSATHVSTTTNRNYDPKISGDTIVWRCDDDGVEGVYVWSASSPTPDRVTTYNSQDCSISGNRIVWMESSTQTIYTKLLSESAPTAVPATTLYNYSPQVSGNRIIWDSLDEGWQVHAWTVGDPAPVNLPPMSWDAGERLSGNLVAYAGNDGDNEIYVYDLASEANTKVTNNAIDDVSVVISGNRLAWLAIVDGVRQVMTWSVGDAAPVQVTNGSTNNSLAGVSASLIGLRNTQQVYAATLQETQPPASPTATPASSIGSLALLVILAGFASIFYRKQTS